MNRLHEQMAALQDAVPGLQRLLLETLEDPAGHLTEAVTFLGIAVALLGIGITLAALVFWPARPRRRLRRIGPAAPDSTRASSAGHPSEEGPRAVVSADADVPETGGCAHGASDGPGAGKGARRRLPPWFLVACAVAVMFAAVVALWYGTGSDAYCSEVCHADTDVVVRTAKDAHARVRCVDCHETAGVAAAALQRWRFVRSELDGSAGRRVLVDSDACLSCHEDPDADGGSDVLLMSHAEPIADGMVCDDCHEAIGHSDSTATVASLRQKTMNSCLRCHDGTVADERCPTCHVGDPALSVASSRIFPKVSIPADRDCGGCHSQERCDACHGLRMPHSRAFRDGGHARSAAFSGGERLCTRCHERSSCSSACHSIPWDEHGGERFRREHATYPFDSGCGCHTARTATLVTIRKPGTPFCELCHYPGSARLLPPIR